jgi:hypothetical protein
MHLVDMSRTEVVGFKPYGLVSVRQALAEPGGGSGRRDHAPTRLISVNGPNPSIERTSSGKLRFPAAPAHVER